MSNINHVTFPGLGLEFDLNEIAFTIGSLNVRWYGIILCAGIIAGFIYFLNRASKTEGIDPDHVYNITLFTVIIAIIGARFTYVITNLDDYNTFWDMINITNGGIAIYGAIIFGGATVIIYCRAKKLNTYAVLDSLAPGVLLGQIIGRWGNFVNAEAYGYSEGVEKLPWRMGVDTVFIDDKYRSDIQFVHPTFLYESLWNLIGFIIISFIYRKKKFDGQIFYCYIIWYGLGRGFIEMLRTDSLRIAGLKLNVIIGFATFIAAVILYFVLLKRSKKELQNAVSYESKYSALKVAAEGDALKPIDTSVLTDEEEADEETEADPESDQETLAEQDSLDGDSTEEKE
jgi:phosphatidylglycerol:prolipoprotein diacylglycerol transferase